MRIWGSAYGIGLSWSSPRPICDKICIYLFVGWYMISAKIAIYLVDNKVSMSGNFDAKNEFCDHRRVEVK